MATKTGFIKDYKNNILLPITRAELVKDADGACAFHSSAFAADEERYGLMSPEDKAKLNGDGDQSLSGLDALIKQLSKSIQVNTVPLDLLSTGLNIIDSEQIKATFDKGTLKLTLPTSLPLTSALVDTVLENDKSIVNRKWVSEKIQDQFDDAIQIATGSLKFKGLLEKSVTSEDLNKSKVGDFYKVGNNAVTVNGTSVKRGDTILVAEENSSKYWCIIPSGDEIQTTLSVNSKVLLGSIHLASGSSDLTITTSQESGDVGGTITFTQNPAKVENGTVTPGSFSQQVYNTLSSQITTGVKYTSAVTDGVAVGTLGENVPITIPKLIVTNISNVPTIKYNSIPNDGIKITSGNGIAITRGNSDSELSAALRVATSDQLKFNTSGELQLNVWKTTDTNNNNGLVTFGTLSSAVSANVLFTEVGDPNNLSGDEKLYLVFEKTSTNN